VTEAENPRAVAGDNNPPDPLLEEAAERAQAADKWLATDWEKWDATTADKANAFLGQVTTTHKTLDDRRLEEGRAFKAEQDKVYKDPLALLVIAKDKLVAMRRKWLQREDARVQEERRKAEAEAEAKRLAAEEAVRKAAQPVGKKGSALEAELAAAKAQEAAEETSKALEAAPEKAQIKGAYSARATGLRDVWSAEITDISAAFKHYNKKGHSAKSLIAAAVENVIQTVATQEAKTLKDASKAPPGIKFVKERR
jgi:hypothetical protein